jgi:hypothetical protein
MIGRKAGQRNPKLLKMYRVTFRARAAPAFGKLCYRFDRAGLVTNGGDHEK